MFERLKYSHCEKLLNTRTDVLILVLKINRFESASTFNDYLYLILEIKHVRITGEYKLYAWFDAYDSTC